MEDVISSTGEKMKTKALVLGLALLLLAYTASAALTVQSFSCNSQSGIVVVDAGGTLTCETSIKNTGSSAASVASVELLTDSVWAESTSYAGLGFTTSLAAGATSTATFGNIKPTTPGVHNFNYIKIDSVTDSTPASSNINVISIKNLKIDTPVNASLGDDITIGASVTSGGNTEITLTIDVTNCTLKEGESPTRNLGVVSDNTLKTASWKAVMGSGNCTYNVSASGSAGTISLSKEKISTVQSISGILSQQITLISGWNLFSLPLLPT